MAIFLDTSVLPNPPARLDTVTMAVIRALAAESGHELILPETVVDEWVNRWIEAAKAAFQALVSATKEAARYASVDPPFEPDFEATAEARRQELSEVGRVAPMPAGIGEEAIRREAQRIPPAREGRGGRDSAIWLTAVAEHLALATTSYFVTANTADFADPLDRSSLHPRLLSDLPPEAPPLELVTSPDDLLTRLGDPAELPEDLDLFGECEPVLQALRAAVVGHLAQVTTPGLSAASNAYAAAPVRLQFERSWGEKAFQIESRRITVISTRCTFETTLGVLTSHPGGGLAERIRHATGVLNATLILRGESVEEGMEADVQSTAGFDLQFSST